MADELPDLDTDTVGWVAYWNAVEHGATAIDPLAIANNFDDLDNFSTYANGFDAEVEVTRELDDTTFTIPPIQVHVRVKTDGWVLAWMDNRESFKTSVGFYGDPDVRGLNDIIPHWSNFRTPPSPDLTENVLADVISQVYESSSSSGLQEANFSLEDVGLYNYEYPEATTAVALVWDTMGEGSAGLLFGQETEIVAWHHSFTARNYSSDTMEVVADGLVLSDMPAYGSVIDVLDEGIFQEPETVHTTEILQSNQYRHAVMTHLILVE